MKLSVIILTFNEEIHLARCIESVKDLAGDLVVVDCFSTDATLEIAQNLGARIVQHEWLNHAAQFNWALSQLNPETEWVLRIDADEYLTPELLSEVHSFLAHAASNVDGAFLNRRMIFQGKHIRHGGVFPIQVLRLFRYGKGLCENRWMDEHIKVGGPTVVLKGELIDDNLNSLSWWTQKHNHYASREAIEMLNLRYHFILRDSIAGSLGGSQSGAKRWLKETVYSRLPSGFRAFAYFFYRYIIRLGFLDGQAGTEFHFLQGFWYRYLVDAKVAEVKQHMREHGIDVVTAIDRVLGVKIH